MKSFYEWTTIKERHAGRSVIDYEKEILHNAIKTGDIDEVRNLLDSGQPLIDHENSERMLSLATMSGNPELVKLVRDAYRAWIQSGTIIRP